MKKHIGTVTLTTTDNEKHTTEVFRDPIKLKRAFLHPRQVLSTAARQMYAELEQKGFKVQSVCIDEVDLLV